MEGPLFFLGAMEIEKMATKAKAIKIALSYYTGKGVINVGSGYDRGIFQQSIGDRPEVKYNIDLAAYGSKGMAVDLEQAGLPFYDREFDCTFASHILEHLTNWGAALTEWARVSDHVVIVLPHPWAPGVYLTPEHKQFFSFQDIENIKQRWDRVQVFY